MALFRVCDILFVKPTEIEVKGVQYSWKTSAHPIRSDRSVAHAEVAKSINYCVFSDGRRSCKTADRDICCYLGSFISIPTPQCEQAKTYFAFFCRMSSFFMTVHKYGHQITTERTKKLLDWWLVEVKERPNKVRRKLHKRSGTLS